MTLIASASFQTVDKATIRRKEDRAAGEREGARPASRYNLLQQKA